MPSPDNPDLGFTFHMRRTGEVQLLRRGKIAGTLRGSAAAEFLVEMQSCADSEAQQIMARLTGNYKHGNERQAIAHPRNNPKLA
ncbi:MAG: hypothetical protein ABI790_11695 [Betaproteobacteria bacterium]